MRLWSLHPHYLDPQGLVALWREALLAQAVLRGETKGYRNHPQLERFRQVEHSQAAVSRYLQAVYAEAVRRGYQFDKSKIRPARATPRLSVTTGQLAYEWSHLLTKLKVRSPDLYRQWQHNSSIQPHPLFVVREGEIEPWERV